VVSLRPVGEIDRRQATTVGRKLVPTPDGELLLGYARTIMSLEEEVRNRLAAPKLRGQVILGMPDL